MVCEFKLGRPHERPILRVLHYLHDRCLDDSAYPVSLLTKHTARLRDLDQRRNVGGPHVQLDFGTGLGSNE
jgi:hypothetical protein